MDAVRNKPGPISAFTLAEVLVTVAISALFLVGLVRGYLLSAHRAEWSTYSLAAQSLAIQRLEQTRACRWDVEANPAIDQLTTANFPAQASVLDIPCSGGTQVMATNLTTITTVSAVPPLKQVRVDCIWEFLNGRLFTNTVVCYRTPDT